MSPKSSRRDYAALMPEGLLWTGDIAKMDRDGFVRMVGGKNDLVAACGFKVYPNEIEELVAAHESVLEGGAVGVPDQNSGGAVKVVVKTDLTAKQLIARCCKHLTDYKHLTDCKT